MKLLCLFLFLSFFSSLSFSQDFELKLEEVLVIGDEDTDSLEYILGPVHDVVTDSKGNIYVAQRTEIRVFNPMGKYITTLGRQGRGPGEFAEVSFMSIESGDTLLVGDRMQERIHLFSLKDSLILTFPIPEPTFAVMGFSTLLPGTNKILAGIGNYDPSGADGDYIRIYDIESQTKESSFLNLFDHFFDIEDPLELRLSHMLSSSQALLPDSKLALTPNAYYGDILVYDLNTKEAEFFGQRIQNIYTEHKSSDIDKLTRKGIISWASSSSSLGKFLYTRKGTTINLVANNHLLLHFYKLFEDGKISVPFLKIYNLESSLLSTVKLSDISSEFVVDNKTNLHPSYLDDDFKLYSSSFYSDFGPLVKVFQTNLNELIRN